MALAAVLCGAAWAGGPDTPQRNEPQRLADEAVETAERWIETGRPGEALALLLDAIGPAREGDLDTTRIRFTAAQALLRMRRYAEAAAILGQLAGERPDIDRFRLDHAAALFALGRDDEAGAVFRDVRRQEHLPPAVRRNVEHFLMRIRARQRWRIDLDMGFWRDDNVNNAPERETVDVPLFGRTLPIKLDERPVRAWVARTGARLRWREPVTASGRSYVESQASVARNTALGASAHNRTWAGLSAGPRAGYAVEIAGRRRLGVIHADLGAERRWRGGSGYATSLWAGLGVDQSVAGNWRAGSSARLWTTRHDGGSGDVDPLGRSLGLHVSRRVGPGWLTAGGTLARAVPKRQSLRWTSRGVLLAYAADFGRDWSLSVQASRIKTGFDGEHPLFLTRRKDRTHGLGLTLSHRALAWEGYLPEIVLDWARTDSNIPLYDRQVRILRFGLRRLF